MLNSIPEWQYIERGVTSAATFKNIWRRRGEFLQPSKGMPVDIGNTAFSPNGKHVAGAATVCEELNGTPPNRLAILNRENSKLSTFGQREKQRLKAPVVA